MHKIRFFKTSVKDAKPIKLLGRGTLQIEADEIKISGKKLLSLGSQFLIFILVLLCTIYIEKYLVKVAPDVFVLLFVPNVVLALIADLIARKTDNLTIKTAGIERILQHKDSKTFLVVYGKSPSNVIAFKFLQQDSANSFKGSFESLIRPGSFSASMTL